MKGSWVNLETVTIAKEGKKRFYRGEMPVRRVAFSCKKVEDGRGGKVRRKAIFRPAAKERESLLKGEKLEGAINL